MAKVARVCRPHGPQCRRETLVCCTLPPPSCRPLLACRQPTRRRLHSPGLWNSSNSRKRDRTAPEASSRNLPLGNKAQEPRCRVGGHRMVPREHPHCSSRPPRHQLKALLPVVQPANIQLQTGKKPRVPQVRRPARDLRTSPAILDREQAHRRHPRRPRRFWPQWAAARPRPQRRRCRDCPAAAVAAHPHSSREGAPSRWGDLRRARCLRTPAC